jgi:predicted GNAT family N-acyltransferase
MITLKDLRFEIIDFASPEYEKSLHIRDMVLRKPLGMSIYNDNLKADEIDTHIAAILNDEIVGTLILNKLSSIEIKMRQVAVNHAMKGEGIGAKMVAFSEEVSKKMGYSKMILHARKVVVLFYQKQGYRTLGEEFLEVGIPHFKMEKDL